MPGFENRLLFTIENDKVHTHDYAQILLPLNTEIQVQFKNSVYHIGINELFFIAPGTPHQCLCKNELIIFNIPHSMIKKGDLQVLSDKTVVPLEGSMIQLAELIRAETANGSKAMMRHLYYYLYEKLVENNSFHSIRYIREHFDENVSVEKLAELENYNPTYFIAWFRRKTGYTPLKYLKMYRIEKAKELLLHSQFNILEIALQVGYCSHAAFSRTFKNEVGCTPAEFREKHEIESAWNLKKDY